MIVKVLGVQSIEYVNKQDKTVKGTKVYYSRDPLKSEHDVMGVITDNIYISDAAEVSLPSFKIGFEYDFHYEYDGKYSHLVEITEYKKSA